MSERNYLYRQHSRRSREEMAIYLMATSQKLYTALLLSTFGGVALYLKDFAAGESWLGQVEPAGKVVIYALAFSIFASTFWGANRLRNYALKIWDDLESEGNTEPCA